MTRRRRSFLHSEMESAAKIAAQHGVSVSMMPDGSIRFDAHARGVEEVKSAPSAEDELNGWLDRV